jgi:ABC-2 type transport system permease protein
MSAEALGRVGHPGDAIRFGDVLAAEFAKIRTLPATWLALAIALPANLLLGILAAGDVVRIAGRDGQTAIGEFGTLMVAPVYAFVAIAVHAAGSEYRAGQVRVSRAAVPHRNRLYTAKLTAVAAVSVVAAFPALLSGYLSQHAAAIGGGRLGTAAVAGDVAARLTVYLLLSLIGFGFAVIARGVVTPLAVLVGTPVLISPMLWSALPDLVRFLPHEAALSLLGLAGHPAALPRTGGLLTLLGWAALFVAGAWADASRRDS